MTMASLALSGVLAAGTPRADGKVPRKGSNGMLPSLVSTMWSWGYRGQQERSPDWGRNGQRLREGFKGRDSPLISMTWLGVQGVEVFPCLVVLRIAQPQASD